VLDYTPAAMPTRKAMKYTAEERQKWRTPIWKDIDGFNGYYSVSDRGQVRSNSRVVIMKDGRTKTIKDRILKTKVIKGGYLTVQLSLDGVAKNFPVHRLVATAFIPNPEGKPFINHIDFNPSNNLVENLELCSQKENIWHSYSNGRMIAPQNERLDESILSEIKDLIDKGLSQREIQKKLGVSRKTITKYFPQRDPVQLISDERLARIKQMLETGCSKREVVRELKIGFKTIHKYFPEYQHES